MSSRDSQRRDRQQPPRDQDESPRLPSSQVPPETPELPLPSVAATPTPPTIATSSAGESAPPNPTPVLPPHLANPAAPAAEPAAEAPVPQIPRPPNVPPRARPVPPAEAPVPPAAPSLQPSPQPAAPAAQPITKKRTAATNTPADPQQSAAEEAESTNDESIEPDWRDRALAVARQIATEGAPPWAVSMFVHLLVVIVLAVIVFQPPVDNTFVVEVLLDKDTGEQLVDDRLTQESLEPLDELAAVAIESQPTDDPSAAIPQVEINLEIFQSPTTFTAPSIGMALSGREAGAKRALLAAYGGTGETESAVQLALEWLKRNQQRDGSWSLAGPYADGVDGSENRLAATAMALLALQGSGNTHLQGEFAPVVKRGMEVLLRMQDRDGSFIAKESLQSQHQLYSQGQATIAICELYGMTQDQKLREPAQLAIDYAVSIQAETEGGGGGWRYQPGQGVDTSVTGWFVMALQSGRMARLDVPQQTLDKISLFLDSVTLNGIRYGYRTVEDERISMTAEALLCRQYLGWDHDDARLLAGARLINREPVDWEKPNVYYWYYATQVLHHMGGDAWDEWNQVMRRVLPTEQVKTGRERGSWSPAGDPYGYRGGRLYMTCFCVYMLEVYYRHLPLYQH